MATAISSSPSKMGADDLMTTFLTASAMAAVGSWARTRRTEEDVKVPLPWAVAQSWENVASSKVFTPESLAE